MSATTNLSDLSVLRDHLEKAKRHVATGEGLLARQRALVEEMQRNGHDTGRAKALLSELERAQTVNLAEVARLTTELAEFATQTV